jgi:hypothetical protein
MILHPRTTWIQTLKKSLICSRRARYTILGRMRSLLSSRTTSKRRTRRSKVRHPRHSGWMTKAKRYRRWTRRKDRPRSSKFQGPRLVDLNLQRSRPGTRHHLQWEAPFWNENRQLGKPVFSQPISHLSLHRLRHPLTSLQDRHPRAARRLRQVHPSSLQVALIYPPCLSRCRCRA